MLRDPEYLSIVTEISLLSCQLYIGLKVAIFELTLIYTSGSLRCSSVALPDPENMGIA